MLIAVDDEIGRAALRDGDGHDVVLELPVVPRGHGALVAAKRVCVLLLAGDRVLAAEVLGRFEHPAFDEEAGFAAGRDAPAIEAVVHGDMAAGGSPAHVQRVELGVAHAFDTAGEDDVCDAGLDLHGRQADGLEPGTAAAIELEAGDLDGKARTECREAPHRGVLAVGVALPEDHVVDGSDREGLPLDDLRDDEAGHRFGGDGPQGTAKAADGRAHSATDQGIFHRSLLAPRGAAATVTIMAESRQLRPLGRTNQATYAYDAVNRLSSVTDWNSRAVSYAYDDAGRMTTATLPASTGIVSSYSYDNADRLTGISHVKDGNNTIASVAYTLDAVGNRTQRVDQQGTNSYAYDSLYRLTSVTYPGPSTTSYAFDAFGNRTSMTQLGNQVTSYAYDDADRLTSVTPPPPGSVVNYSWDNNGDLTARGADSFGWDYEDRMTAATVNGVATTFVYRGDGLRHSRTKGGTTVTFTWDVNGSLPVVLDDGSQYVYGAGLAAMVTATGTYYYLADGLGSTMAMVDTSGAVQKSYTYDVYGAPTATGTVANEFDFAGQGTEPSTGLQYLRARYMDPATGRFISRDALTVRPSWSQHPFSYVGANPAVRTDPTGNMFPSDDGGGGGTPSRCPTQTGQCPSGATFCPELPQGMAFGFCPSDPSTWPVRQRGDLNICAHKDLCVAFTFKVIDYARKLIGEYRLNVNSENESEFEEQGWTNESFLDLLKNGKSYTQEDGTQVVVKAVEGGGYDLVQFTKDGIATTRRGLNLSEISRLAGDRGWQLAFPD